MEDEGHMGKVPHILLLVILLSNASAAQEISNADRNDAATNAKSGVNGTSPNGLFSIDASANSASSMREVKPPTDSKISQHPDRLYRASQLAFIGSIMADLGTTWSFPKGEIESNRLLGRNKAQQASVSGAMALFILWEAHLLHVTGKTRAAKYLIWIGTGAHVFAASYNVR